MKSPKPKERKGQSEEPSSEQLLARLRRDIDLGILREHLMDTPDTRDPVELCFILRHLAHDLGHEVYRLVQVLDVADTTPAKTNIPELTHKMKVGQQSAERCLRFTRQMREALHTLSHAVANPQEAGRREQNTRATSLTAVAATSPDHDFDLAEAFRTFFATARPWTRRAKIRINLELVDGMLVRGTLMEFQSALWTILLNTIEALKKTQRSSRRIWIQARPLGSNSTREVAVFEYRDSAAHDSPGINIATEEMLRAVRASLKARFAGDISVVENKGRHWVASIPVHRRK